jgi:adenosylcobinamide-GDP ribazoletransferase
MRLFFIALQFLTRVPVPGGVGFDAQALNRSVRHFPLVGALVGATGAAVALVALALWPPAVAALLAVAFTVWLSAAFHEDGLADTFDALLGAAPRDKALAIMKDSRIGSYGAVALVLSLGLRVVLLAELLARDPMRAAAVLVASHAAGRAVAVLLMATSVYAGDEAQAKARPLARSVRGVDAVWATLVSLPVVALPVALGSRPLLRGVMVGVMLAVLVVAMRRWLHARLGGYTGDTLGATEQFGEVAVLLAFVATLA